MESKVDRIADQMAGLALLVSQLRNNKESNGSGNSNGKAGDNKKTRRRDAHIARSCVIILTSSQKTLTATRYATRVGRWIIARQLAGVKK